MKTETLWIGAVFAAVVMTGQASAAIPVTVTNGVTVVRVADAGAVPDDGICDAEAIRSTIAAVEGLTNVVVEFDAGVYNLNESAIQVRSGRRALVFV